MGHYDSAYEYDESKSKAELNATRKKVEKLIVKALDIAKFDINREAISDNCRHKLKEALFWLEESYK